LCIYKHKGRRVEVYILNINNNNNNNNNSTW